MGVKAKFCYNLPKATKQEPQLLLLLLRLLLKQTLKWRNHSY